MEQDHMAELARLDFPGDLTEEPDLELLGDTQALIERFVDLPTTAHGLVLATFVAHTYCFEAAFVTPYIYISSKQSGTGKSRCMDVLSMLVRNPDSGTDSPAHVLGQEIAASCPTLLFDEMDTTYAGQANNQLKRILNIGYRRGAVIKRQRANEVETWTVFCAKVLAGIRNNHLPQSLLSRCIPIEMQPRRRELERFNQFHMQLDPQRNDVVERMQHFSGEFLFDVANQRPEPLKALDDRQNEICEPLLAIAAVLGREDDLRQALRTLYGGEMKRVTREQAFLTKIRAAFDAQASVGKPTDRIWTDDLLRYLGRMYNGRTLGILLREMRFVRTAEPNIRITIGHESEVRRGYMRVDFEPLFERHLDVERPSVDVETLEEDAA